MPKRAIKPEDLFMLHFVGDPQISPDGQRIAFSKRHIDPEKNKYVGQVYTVDLDGSCYQWTTVEGGASAARWSPCGNFISFISGREGKSPQLYNLPTQGGESRKLTSLKEGSIGNYKWSPDGAHIAFTYRETHPNWTQSAQKEREASGASIPPREIDDIWYRLDGDGYFLNQRYALYILNFGTGQVSKLYDPVGLDHFDFDWSPNGQEIVVSETINKRPSFEATNDRLVRLDLDGNRWELEGIPGSKSLVRWSPDGKWIGFLGNNDPGNWGAKNEKLYVVAADGGETRELSEGTDYCLMVGAIADTKDAYGEGILEWSPDSKAIYVTIGWHGEVQIGYAQIDKSGIELLTKGHHYLACGNVSPDGERIACVYGDPMHPVEIGFYDISKHGDAPTKLTNFNAKFLDEVKLSEPEEIWLETPDGTKVQAWAMMPIDYLPPRRYPAVLEVHGGPHTQYGWVFFHEFQVLAAEGYVVVFSNPRGSKGYGEEHCTAISGDWGNADWVDIQTVLHWMQHQSYIHPGQIGIMGGSYGGYMTNWAIGHTNDFKAAITDRCVSNMVSFGGNSDFVMSKDGYYPGVFFGNIDQLWKSSPIAYFENVTTPTLIIHSEGDLRCNIEQSEQVFSALQHLGVESRFIRYPATTSHGMSRGGPPDLRIHRLKEITSWWQRHLKGGEA